jgi:hypothetical protein
MGGRWTHGRAHAASVAVCAIVAFAGVGTDEAHAGATFASGRTLEASWSRLLSGERITACDGGRSPAPSVKVVPAGFEFTRGGTSATVEPEAVLTVSGPSTIAAGSCVSMLLRATPTEKPDPGEYKGTLLLVTAGLGTSRLAAAITVPGTTPGTPSGISDEPTLSLHTGLSNDKAHGTLLLKPPTGEELPLKLGSGCPLKSATPAAGCEFIGNLSRDQQVIHVTIDGPVEYEKDKHVQELPVVFSSSRHIVGDYQGSVTLSDAGEPQTIKVKLSASDSIGWAILALTVGALIPLLLQLWEERYVPKHGLKRRIKAIPSGYAKATPSFPKIVVVEKTAESYASEVRKALRRYAASVALLDKESDAFKEIDKAIELAENDAHLLSDKAGLSASLIHLRGAVNKTAELLGRYEVSDVPSVLGIAAAPLQDGELKVGGATERAERADRLVELLDQWRDVAEGLFATAIWLKQIVADVPTPVEKIEDARTLAYAGSQLWSAREALFKATDKAALNDVASSDALESARRLIAYLAAAYKVARPAADLKPTELGGDLSDVGYLVQKGPAVGLAALVSKPAEVTITSAKPAQLPRSRRILLGDAIALIVTVAIGVATGLSAFYFGKSWGTIEDFVTVVIVGAAAQTLAKTVLDRLEVFLHDISPVQPTKTATSKRVVGAPGA